MIVTEWDHKVADIVTALWRFNEESEYKLTSTPSKVQEYLYRLFSDPNTVIIVNYDELGMFRGFAIASIDNEFQNEYFGYLLKFYILPEGRGTYAAREIMQELVDFFDYKDCVASFATATAGIGQDKAFINLFAKFGYKHTGTALIRKQHEQS